MRQTTTKFTRVIVESTELTHLRGGLGSGSSGFVFNMKSDSIQETLKRTSYDLPLDLDRVVVQGNSRQRKAPQTVRLRLGLMATQTSMVQWSQIEQMEAAEFTVDWLRKHGLRSLHILTAGLTAGLNARLREGSPRCYVEGIRKRNLHVQRSSNLYT